MDKSLVPEGIDQLTPAVCGGRPVTSDIGLNRTEGMHSLYTLDV